MRHLRRASLIVAAVSAVFAVAIAEFGVRLLAHRGAVPYRPFRTTENSAFWADVNSDFGVWHVPNASFRHVMPCFEATYHSNSYGARDRARARHSTRPRTVVLGDSFVEGYGIEDGLRMTDRLEASTGVEHLNFGTAGGFGTVQELVLYRTLASTFDHSRIVLFVLPVNDFSDNDPSQWPARRFRPYLRKTGGGFETYYTVKFDDRDVDVLPPSKQAVNWFSNHLYFLNLVREIRDGWRPGGRQVAAEGPVAASYDGFTDTGLDVMTEAFKELAVSAAGRPVDIFIVPIQSDLDKCFRAGYEFPLIDRLKRTIQNAGAVRVIDLLPDFVAYSNSITSRRRLFSAV